MLNTCVFPHLFYVVFSLAGKHILTCNSHLTHKIILQAANPPQRGAVVSLSEQLYI